MAVAQRISADSGRVSLSGGGIVNCLGFFLFSCFCFQSSFLFSFLLLTYSHFWTSLVSIILNCPLHAHTYCPSFCPATAMSASGSGIPNAASGSSSGVKKGFPQVDLSGNDLPPSPAPSSPHTGRRYNIATELVFTEGSDQYNASSVPIYQVQIHPG